MLSAIIAMEKGYQYIKEINDETTLACFIGTMIDQWIADHDKEFEVGDMILENVLAVRKSVFEAEGMMMKSEA